MECQLLSISFLKKKNLKIIQYINNIILIEIKILSYIILNVEGYVGLETSKGNNFTLLGCSLIWTYRKWK